MMRAEQEKSEEKSKDDAINEVGTDVPTVEKPKKATADEDKAKDKVPAVKKPKDPVVIITAALKYLASNTLGTPEYADFRQAFPDLFKEE